MLVSGPLEEDLEISCRSDSPRGRINEVVQGTAVDVLAVLIHDTAVQSFEKLVGEVFLSAATDEIDEEEQAEERLSYSWRACHCDHARHVCIEILRNVTSELDVGIPDEDPLSGNLLAEGSRVIDVKEAVRSLASEYTRLLGISEFKEPLPWGLMGTQ